MKSLLNLQTIAILRVRDIGELLAKLCMNAGVIMKSDQNNDVNIRNAILLDGTACVELETNTAIYLIQQRLSEKVAQLCKFDYRKEIGISNEESAVDLNMNIFGQTLPDLLEGIKDDQLEKKQTSSSSSLYSNPEDVPLSDSPFGFNIRELQKAE
ncbi:MAG: hypothetical protein EZS28_021702, partial [Streblomastix strix]